MAIRTRSETQTLSIPNHIAPFILNERLRSDEVDTNKIDDWLILNDISRDHGSWSMVSESLQFKYYNDFDQSPAMTLELQFTPHKESDRHA